MAHKTQRMKKKLKTEARDACCFVGTWEGDDE